MEIKNTPSGAPASTDLRLLLCDELARRCRTNPRYSMRAFARSLKLSHSLLSMILSHKRALSKSAARKIVAALELNPELARDALARVGKARAAAEKMQEAAKTFREVDLDFFSIIADWYSYAILSLLELPNAKFDRHWISRRLNITVTEAKLAMDRLQRVGLLAEDKDGRWRQTGAPIRLYNPISTEVTRGFHRQLLNKALQALDNEPFERRVFASITLPVSSERVEHARRRIEDAKIELSDEFEAKPGEATDVYQLLVQFYPLTPKEFP